MKPQTGSICETWTRRAALIPGYWWWITPIPVGILTIAAFIPHNKVNLLLGVISPVICYALIALAHSAQTAQYRLSRFDPATPPGEVHQAIMTVLSAWSLAQLGLAIAVCGGMLALQYLVSPSPQIPDSLAILAYSIVGLTALVVAPWLIQNGFDEWFFLATLPRRLNRNFNRTGCNLVTIVAIVIAVSVFRFVTWLVTRSDEQTSSMLLDLALVVGIFFAINAMLGFYQFLLVAQTAMENTRDKSS